MVGILGQALAVDEKCDVFFCLSRFGMTKFVITETLLSSVIFKTMVPLHRGNFVVLPQYAYFSIDSQEFSLEANLY